MAEIISTGKTVIKLTGEDIIKIIVDYCYMSGENINDALGLDRLIAGKVNRVEITDKQGTSQGNIDKTDYELYLIVS